MGLHKALSADRMGLKMLGPGLLLGGLRVRLCCLALHCCFSPGLYNHFSFLIIPFRVLPWLPFTLFLDFIVTHRRKEKGEMSLSHLILTRSPLLLYGVPPHFKCFLAFLLGLEKFGSGKSFLIVVK